MLVGVPRHCPSSSTTEHGAFAVASVKRGRAVYVKLLYVGVNAYVGGDGTCHVVKPRR